MSDGKTTDPRMVHEYHQPAEAWVGASSHRIYMDEGVPPIEVICRHHGDRCEIKVYIRRADLSQRWVLTDCVAPQDDLGLARSSELVDLVLNMFVVANRNKLSEKDTEAPKPIKLLTSS